MTTPELLIENERRKAALFPYYDPLLGIGSPIDRFEVRLNDVTSIFLPVFVKGMFPDDLCRDLPKYCAIADIPIEDMMVYIEQIRYIHDFEYWCVSDVKITDKEGSQLIAFMLRPAQRKLFAVLYNMFIAGVPILVILLKARQWGGSTLVQIFMIWLQLFHYKNWNSVIIGDNENQARTIRGMYTRLVSHLPMHNEEVRLTPYEGSNKNKVLSGRDCVVSIGSMQQPESLRSTDIRMAHLTEVASWKETLGKKPEDLVQNIRATIPMIPGAMEVLESTAKGVGNFWHQEYLAAKSGESGYTPVFVAWWEIEMYVKPFHSDKDELSFIANMNEYDMFLWNLGATLEGIHWYKVFKKAKRYSDWRMKSEFPSTDTEAFQSSGSRVFDPENIERARLNNCPPIFIGDIISDAPKGTKAFDNIRFVANPQGPLKIWAFPDPEPYAHRYVVPVDIGGKSKESDWSVTRVLDREPLLGGSGPEAILTYKVHIDHDLLAWKSAMIAHVYQKGLLVPESNTLDQESTEGDHMLSILKEISGEYDNLYCRTSPEKIRMGKPQIWGYHTNRKTKPAMVSNINAAFRDDGYTENDASVCDEADSYEVKSDGSYGAVSGSHDDELVCTAIGLDVSNEMPRPYRVEPKYIIKKTFKKTEAVL